MCFYKDGSHRRDRILKFDVACTVLSSTARFIHVYSIG